MTIFISECMYVCSVCSRCVPFVMMLLGGEKYRDAAAQRQVQSSSGNQCSLSCSSFQPRSSVSSIRSFCDTSLFYRGYLSYDRVLSWKDPANLE